MYYIYYIALLVIMDPTLRTVVDACGGSKAKPPSLLFPTPLSPTTTPTSGHRSKCTEDEAKTTACMNGGKCFALEAMGRMIMCECPENFRGSRCELRAHPSVPAPDRKKLKTAGIAIGVVFIGLAVVIGAIIAVKKRKARRQRQQPGTAEDQRTQNTQG